MNMFNIESYITPILLSYVDKYVRDFKPADAQVSLWAGGVTLHNLVLKADVLQQEVALPFTLVSGRIHELLIQVPWTKIMSEPIVVTINTIECILSLNPPVEEVPPQEANSGRPQVVEAPPGYMQALVRRIVSNIAVRVHSLIVKYVHDDIVLSLNVKRLSVDSVGPNWEPAFADIDQNQPAIRRLVRLDDVTLCLDKSDSDGKIRFYHEPLLYRCQLDLRVLTRLVSASTRRARSLGVQLRSARLAWGANDEQLALLLRLLRERAAPPPHAPPQPSAQATPLHTTSSSSEPARRESWSEWAWSWLPWMDSEGVEETPARAAPVPLAFTAHFDHVSLVLKIMETEGSSRKRSRGILELTATDAVVKSSVCAPTHLLLRLGTRNLTLSSHGRCVCGHLDVNASKEDSIIYLDKIKDDEEPWSWVEEELSEQTVETAVAAEEEFTENTEDSEPTELPRPGTEDTPAQEKVDEFWQKMAPVVFLEYNHERSPPNAFTNPYDNPPRDFEYSDWVEKSSLNITARPMLVSVTTGLLHRLAVVRDVLKEVPPMDQPEIPMRTLTVEECESLSENLPQRHTSVEIVGLRVRLIPAEHSERPAKPPLVLDLQLPKATVMITGPLYPHRVCSAACQMPEDGGTLWRGARLHVTAHGSLQAGLCSPAHDAPRPCARADVKLVTHTLLNTPYFSRRECVLFSYTVKIREASICGSAARLQAAYHAVVSTLNERVSAPLRHTSLAKDAVNDEELAAVDVTLEDVTARGFITKNVNTHFITAHSARAMAFHSPTDGEVRQAWLFSGPESPTTTPYLRIAVQWCKDPLPSMIEYLNVLVEPTAISVDPLLVAWLSYRPRVKTPSESQAHVLNVRTISSSQFLLRRKATPPSSSGRGASRSGSGAELVHVRPRSAGSGSERSDKRDSKPSPQTKPESWLSGERLRRLHERLNRLLLSAEAGLVQVYAASGAVSAVDCASVRDAMERHALAARRVLVLSLGRLSMNSNSQMKYLWQTIRHDQPTYFRPQREQNVIEDSFPWKTRLADMSCYVLEVSPSAEPSGREKTVSGLKSQLKASRVVLPRTVLDPVTTTVTLSVVTKCLQIKNVKKTDAKPKHSEPAREEDKTKYFTTGVDFKPSSLKEFIRGPIRRSKTSPEPEEKAPEPPPAFKTTYTTGPVVSLGVNLHADTPPLIVKLDHDQVQTVAIAIHGLVHIMTLLQRSSVEPKHGHFGSSSQRNLARSVSDMDALQSLSEETASENRSEQLISIFESQRDASIDTKMKTFFWFQWVVSHATLVVVMPQLKLAFDIDDIISTVDLQNHYNQLKVKVASASVRHYKRSGSEEWTAGALGGRVLEVREPANAQEENHFLAVTVTQARISNLPVSWKEELHPKLLEQNANIDTMWEVYATLAPLEMVLQPDLLEQVMSWAHELTPKHYCPVKHDEPNTSSWQWPFCYMNAGGMRLLLTTGEDNKNSSEDTIMLIVGKVTVNPHPENPICRQSVNGATDTWNSPGLMLEGRQYEVLAKNFAVRTAQFSQLVHEEATESEMLKGTGGENPALKWSQPVVAPTITPVVHSVDVCCILAPAVHSCGAVACGPAVELNLLSDCSVELGIERLELVRTLVAHFAHASRQRDHSSCFIDDETTCPYAPFLADQEMSDSSPTDSETTVSEEVTKSAIDVSRGMVFDSGFETATSQSTYKIHRDSGRPPKKTVSIASLDHTAKASEFLEVFVTMGVIELSLYVGDDGSPEVTGLRPPPGVFRPAETEEPRLKVKIEEAKESKAEKGADDGRDSMSATRSLTETIRNADIGKTTLEVYNLPHARKTEGNIPLIHATLHQPNLYYWKKKKQKTVQVSLFNAWIGLGGGREDGLWHAPLLSTARGLPDPVTEIPPALATLRVDLSSGGFVPISSSSGRGAVQLDVERPILLEVCTDRLRRVKGIMALIEKNSSTERRNVEHITEDPLLYKVRRYMVDHRIESVTVQTGQIGLRGSEGAVGWSALRLQAAAGTRPERLSCRGLVTALLLSAGPPSDRRHIVLQPLMAGAMLDATWEAWRKAEGGLAACGPTVRVGVDIDRITLDLRPGDVAAVARMRDALQTTLGWTERPPTPQSSLSSSSQQARERPGMYTGSSLFNDHSASDCSDPNYHYYKDDLRSGAFKIVSGGQLPMAYQVTLHGNSVAWRYPHPRAITRLVAFPVPSHEEVECALELYCPLLARWEPHTYFQLPVSEPREMQLSSATPDAVFALTWRVRACSDLEQDTPNQPFEFDAKKFMPRQDPLAAEGAASECRSAPCAVTAEQLCGALRVDSYFAPRHMPRARLALRVAALDVHAHNELPALTEQAKSLEGYYVSRPLMRSHRVLSVSIRDTAAHAVFGASSKLLVDTHFSSDILDSATGTMEQLIEEFRIQGTLSLNDERKLRVRAGDVRVALHVPRVCTLRALANDWVDVYEAFIKEAARSPAPDKRPGDECPADALDGRVSLWVHNGCSTALRVGQEDTDELVPLSAGASLAYRWRSPTAPKKIRFAIASPAADWRWSNSIAFSVGNCRVRLEEGDVTTEARTAGGVYLYVRVQDVGSRRDMYLSGRLTLANMLRHNLLYKVRARCSEKNVWQTISSGELNAESVGLSVLCNSECESVLKVKFTTQELGWSGDIPLKECRKENMPWLVKVPSGGEATYTSVWWRVLRARSDARVVAAAWSFYILRSHLPLDVDVLITSGSSVGTAGTQTGESAPRVQTASGRGGVAHLVAPGTTAATHALTFQYRNIECPVTREAVPLHYGVTDSSVFEKPTPINTVEEIIEIIKRWLHRSSRDARCGWPYSIVTNHWPGSWQPALLQPRCDVTVRYQAVRVGGGCSLELQLCPVVLLANASPIALTLRAHDATPLCRLEPGVAISPPTAVLHKPFFLSVELGRETFVSGQLQVCAQEPGRYGQPPPGHLALDRDATFAIHCNQKVALLTMCYEIKEDINILGITSTYILINRLPSAILVSAIAVPNEMERDSVLRPNMFKVVEPTKEGSLEGTPLCRFWMRGRWRGGDAHELRTYLCLALPARAPAAPVPVRLGLPPVRRALALRQEDGQSVPVVVTQVRHEARWVVTVARDPCPQLVVRNRTADTLAVAQPRADDTAPTNAQPVRECSGVVWWCEVEAGGTTHYSTPAHCARFPPVEPPTRPPIPFLTVGYNRGDVSAMEWSQPVAVADGEHLLQLARGRTVKVRVRTHPHSTLVELQDVDQHDISASDIRRRLLGAFSDDSVSFHEENETPSKNEISRVSAYEKFVKEAATQASTEVRDTEEVPLLSAEAIDARSAPQVVHDDNIKPEHQHAGEMMTMTAQDQHSLSDSSLMKLSTEVQNDITESFKSEKISMMTVVRDLSIDYSEPSNLLEVDVQEWSDDSQVWRETERVRCVVGSVAVTVGASADVLPLLAVHLQRAAILVQADRRKTRTTISIADVQIDNSQYETEQYDFAVVATTKAQPQPPERWPPLWGMFHEVFSAREADARLLLRTCHDRWTVAGCTYQELTEVELRVGPLGLYVEDAFVGAAAELFRLAAVSAPTPELAPIAEARTLQHPLRLRRLHLHPLDLTLTLHTAVRMYIALDESPLRLSAFQLQHVMTSAGRLTHALTVHYLSAAILGAGWVVGGLELLGAPGALAARVGSAGGGVRGVASAAAGALLRSLSAAAGSLARNLDLLAGDDDHARRAAQARRRPPPSLMAGLVVGITNFAINILGAVGGLAHHPLVGVAVGESGGGAAALRRGLVGAVAKPLSATADLLAYAGHGLLAQTGWDPVPQPRSGGGALAERGADWRRDCVRWGFRLAELSALAGFDALLNDAHFHLLVTHKFLVVADPESERIVEMIDFKCCTLSPYQGQIVELHVLQKKSTKTSESRLPADEDNDYQISAAAMARVARYTGAAGYAASEARVLALLPAPASAPALHAALAAALQHNNDAHFPLL